MPAESSRMMEANYSTGEAPKRSTTHRVLYWTGAVALIILPAVLGGFSGFFFNSKIYSGDGNRTAARLEQPTWAPPSWLFGPVWTILYLMMGVASFLLVRAESSSTRVIALVFYFFQLALNMSWTPVFFGAQKLCAGVGVICAMWAMILATIVTSLPVNWISSLLLVPYILWVSFATCLNYALVELNGCSPRDA